MDYDPVRHAENRRKFLRSLYKCASEHAAANGGTIDLTLISFSIKLIGESAGLTFDEARRVTSDLKDDREIFFAGGGADGPMYRLSKSGRDIVELEQYEKTFRRGGEKPLLW